MTQATNKYSPEVPERAVRMVLDGVGPHESRWSTARQAIAKQSAERGDCIDLIEYCLRGADAKGRGQEGRSGSA